MSNPISGATRASGPSIELQFGLRQPSEASDLSIESEYGTLFCVDGSTWRIPSTYCCCLCTTHSRKSDGEVVDLSHTGSVLSEERPGDVQAYEVSLSFPGLSSSSIPVTVDFAMTFQAGAGFQGSGTVSLGDRTLASISTETVTNLGDITLLFSWN